MKLSFNTINSGLANNGGSRTVILCSQTLEKLGHRCDIIGVDDRFTWFKHKPIIPYFPSDLEVVIATACTTVASTLSCNVPIKAWYIRGNESWVYNEEQLKTCYNAGLFNIVNSKGLKQKLATYGADSVVVYPGIDFCWENRNLRPKNKIRIGCLYQKKPTKRWKDFVALAKILGTKQYEYVGFGDTMRDDEFLTNFWVHASIEELNNVYSSCHIWFAPTELEGLFNVAIEAALCGCLIVCGDEPIGGMIYDYAFNDNTAMVYERKNIEHAAELIRNPNWSCIERMDNHLRNNIGSREKNMKKLVNYLEEL
ncbi:unnamed protein product [marine sediment metagenome]|uniref:Glycosyl transferase family 1 domain-containing protein n=1 Tax=marine sediment metagenome TaxID=412755 RepID=X0YJ25_9ZZZZ